MSETQQQRLYKRTLVNSKKLKAKVNKGRAGQKAMSVPQIIDAAVLLAMDYADEIKPL